MHHRSKFSRVVILLATFAFLASLVAGQTTFSYQQVRKAVDDGDYQTAMTALQALRATNPERFNANNYDYLLARLQEKAGDVASATATYQTNVTRNSILSEYSLWHLAQMLRAAGDLVQERERLRSLISLAPNSLLRDSAKMRLGLSFFESQDFDSAAAAFRQLSDATKISTAREGQALLGQALVKSGKNAEARQVFTRLLMQMPDAARPDDFALAGARGLDALDINGAGTARIAELAEAEHLLRGSVYHFNRDFDAARLHYAAVVTRFPKNPTVANALYQIGRGFYLQQNYEEALKYFQRVLIEFPESLSARDALSFSAGAYNRLKRTDQAIAAYKQYGDKYAEGPNPERPFLNIIDTLHEAGRHQEALQWVQQTRTRFRTGIGGTLALFAQLRIHLAQGAWQSVIADANELSQASDLGGTRVPGGTSTAEIIFLRAFALEQLNRYHEAILDYDSLPDGRNDYYGKRATQRLLALSANASANQLIQARAAGLRSEAEKLILAGKMDEGRRSAQSALRLTSDQALYDETLELVLRTYDALPAYKLPVFKLTPLGRKEAGPAPQSFARTHAELADELFFLGSYDEAIPELAAAGTQSFTSQVIQRPPAPVLGDRAYSMAIYQLRGGHADQAVKFGEQIWKNIPGDYVLELAPRELVDLLYPLPFRQSLLKHAPARGVDPRFVISIARQESRFQSAAKSVAAARGLMQFIPETSSATAAELGLQTFSQDELYNADTAILFGSQYLAGLFKQFPGQHQAVAAAYNGGPENVARWVARSRANDPDRYVSEIGFTQTKDYVFKVMLNYWQYQTLYDEKLERR